MNPEPVTPGSDDGPISALLGAMRRRWWLVATLLLATIGAALVGLSLRAPTYTSTAQILVTPFPQQADSTLAGIRIVRDSGDGARNLLTATALLESSQNATVAARRLGEGTTVDDVTDAIVVEAAGGSDLVAVAATTGSAERAAEIANAYAEAALAVRDRDVQQQARLALSAIEDRDDASLEIPREQLRTLRDQGDPTLSLAQPASPDVVANGPGGAMVVVAAIVLGLVLGGLGALLLERGDRRVRSRNELLQEIPVPMLVGVPEARGRDGLDMPPAVREAFRTLQLQLEMQRQPLECRRVLVTSASSGDGKTTAVLNLAFALVSAGQRVVVIDFDLRRPSVARELGLTAIEPLSALVGVPVTLGNVMRSAPRLAPLRVVQIAGGPDDVMLLPQLAVRMHALLEEARAVADYVLIDSSPLGEVSDALAIVDAVDDVLLVGRPRNTDRRALDTLSGLLERTDVRPLGWVVTGEQPPTSAYYDVSSRRGRSRSAAERR
jgi:Mrp family chromosome partitioning ATPase/capsular polysaccharide biosynthesis protein